MAQDNFERQETFHVGDQPAAAIAWTPDDTTGESPVGVLQYRIYDHFARAECAEEVVFARSPEPSALVETIVSTVSRAGGVALFVAALAGVVALIV